ncbi:hypothetical protein NI17_004465 [Thermobifida halotolerans]|uniref:Uncharacterized protein n=1 Tax=Thermobifida halotolerans TaxID=483545 RepID=A0A399G4I0_9ACTN|nr:hypothetical protein [Thermobifida halotolerans]UOE20487.1 hypothetical protein NI17_004465 [Thermobifida halotolerans]
MFDTVEDLETYCRSRSDEEISDGYPAAAEYTGPGPHPTVVFRRLPTTDAHVTGYRMADHSPYEEWLPESPEQAVLLVCVNGTSPSPENVDTCEYEPSSVTGVTVGEAFELPLRERTYKFTVYALRTGEEVAAGEIPSADLSCPASVFSDSMVREAGEVYTTIDYGAMLREVEEAVTADAP